MYDELGGRDALRPGRFSLLLIAALLASSSGLLLAVHLHSAEACHDTHHCQTCAALLHPAPATVDMPVLAVVGTAVACDRFVEPQLITDSIQPLRCLGPRAPPASAQS